jgi:hypothetical protein
MPAAAHPEIERTVGQSPRFQPSPARAPLGLRPQDGRTAGPDRDADACRQAVTFECRIVGRMHLRRGPADRSPSPAFLESWLASRSLLLRAKSGASCRIWAILSDLACHSVTIPNEEVAKQNRTAFTRENMRDMPAEFNTILQLFFRICSKAFGVQNGVHFQRFGKNSDSF